MPYILITLRKATLVYFNRQTIIRLVKAYLRGIGILLGSPFRIPTQ